MCQFFSVVILNRGALGKEIYFTEENSHTVVINRLGLEDIDSFHTEHWARVECEPILFEDGTIDTWCVTLDEDVRPEWWEEEKDPLSLRVVELAERVYPAYKAYDDVAGAAYDKWSKTVYDLGWYGPGDLNYKEKKAAEYAAQDTYVQTCDGALKIFIEAIKNISGYVPKN
jgi:uncharacterized CHY-type Zn-finger protein